MLWVVCHMTSSAAVTTIDTKLLNFCWNTNRLFLTFVWTQIKRRNIHAASLFLSTWRSLKTNWTCTFPSAVGEVRLVSLVSTPTHSGVASGFCAQWEVDLFYIFLWEMLIYQGIFAMFSLELFKLFNSASACYSLSAPPWWKEGFPQSDFPKVIFEIKDINKPVIFWGVRINCFKSSLWKR